MTISRPDETQDLAQRIEAQERELEALRREVTAWRAAMASQALRTDTDFSSWSGRSVEPVYTVLDLLRTQKGGLPGEYPYLRGIHPTGYRGKLWTMRQFAGFGTAQDTNERYKFLLARGQTGLSVAFDFPTLMGYDSDHPRSEGEVGKCGVAISCLRDMQDLFDGIPLDRVSTSMTINGPAAMLFCFYVAAAERQGVDIAKLQGTIQNDMLKEYMAQHAWIFPVEPALKVIVDLFEWAGAHTPKWNTISISGYHIREAGATAAQELAFTLANGFSYVEHGLARGLDIDSFAPRLSFFWDVHNDFFEEIAKFRAARRMWARLMKDRFGAKKAESMKLRTHAQTAGVSLTAQQPYNNVVRVALQALAAVLGGTQSLHTNSLDETYALPTEEAVTIALRTQQIIAEETGVASTIDPLGGAWFIEDLTNRMEREALEYIKRIDDMGGMVAAIEKGYPQREIAASAYRFQRQLELGERVMVGVNKYDTGDGAPNIPLLRIDEEVQKKQIANLAKVKATRDASKVASALAAVRKAASANENLMPPIIDAAKAYCTQQEICDVLREVCGTYTDPAEF